MLSEMCPDVESAFCFPHKVTEGREKRWRARERKGHNFKHGFFSEKKISKKNLLPHFQCPSTTGGVRGKGGGTCFGILNLVFVSVIERISNNQGLGPVRELPYSVDRRKNCATKRVTKMAKMNEKGHFGPLCRAIKSSELGPRFWDPISSRRISKTLDENWWTPPFRLIRTLVEVLLPYDPNCPSVVGRLVVGRSACWSVCRDFLKGRKATLPSSYRGTYFIIMDFWVMNLTNEWKLFSTEPSTPSATTWRTQPGASPGPPTSGSSSPCTRTVSLTSF